MSAKVKSKLDTTSTFYGTSVLQCVITMDTSTPMVSGGRMDVCTTAHVWMHLSTIGDVETCKYKHVLI